MFSIPTNAWGVPRRDYIASSRSSSSYFRCACSRTRIATSSILIAAWLAFPTTAVSQEAPSASPMPDIATEHGVQAVPMEQLLLVLEGNPAEGWTCDAKYSEGTQYSECDAMAEAELVRRKPISELFDTADKGWMVRALWATRVLEKIGSPDSEQALVRLARSTPRPGSFGALMHFAKRCETWSLAALNDHWWNFGISSFIWAEAVEQFGVCKYQPSSTNLAAGLSAASLNVVEAACTSLKSMYPTGPECEPGLEGVEIWQAWLAKLTTAPHAP